MIVNWPLISVILLNLFFSTICDMFAKYWSVTGNQSWLYGGVVLNLLTIFFYMCAIRLGGLAITSALVLLITVAISVSLGAFYFHEPVHLSQWIGIALSVPALILISGVLPLLAH